MGSGEVGLAVPQHDWVQVDPVFVYQAWVGQAPRQIRAGNLDLSVVFGLHVAQGAWLPAHHRPLDPRRGTRPGYVPTSAVVGLTAWFLYPFGGVMRPCIDSVIATKEERHDPQRGSR